MDREERNDLEPEDEEDLERSAEELRAELEEMAAVEARTKARSDSSFRQWFAGAVQKYGFWP